MKEGKGLCYMFMSIWVPLESVCEIRIPFILEVIISRSLVEEGSREVIQERDEN